jgi:hypothetical protein
MRVLRVWPPLQSNSSFTARHFLLTLLRTLGFSAAEILSAQEKWGRSVPKHGQSRHLMGSLRYRWDRESGGKICQSESLKMSYRENGERMLWLLLSRTPLKTLSFRPEGHLTSVTWASGPQSAIVLASWSSNQTSQTETRTYKCGNKRASHSSNC